MKRFSPELEEFFKRKGVEFEEVPRKGSDMPSMPSSHVRRKLKSKTKEPDRRGKKLNILNYVLGFKELRSYEKLMVLAAVNAHVRGSVYQARVQTIRNQASCSRATIFRALKKLVPKWLGKISRPGKPNILRPSRMLLKYLRLDKEASGQDRDQGRSLRGFSPWRLNIGTFRQFPNI